MEQGNPVVNERQDQEEGATNAEDRSAWVRRHLRDSIYLWACGEKADDEEDDPKLSDRLIGWLVLVVQGFAYAMLLFLAGLSEDSVTDNSSDDREELPYSPYILASVTGAIYLLVASTTHDLRAGYSLLVDGLCLGHRTFGIGLLVVYGILISAAMKVLMSTSQDNTAVVLNAVTVIFIADLDEKALKFLSTVPQRWRLFWAIYSIGISFVLALLAVVYIGGSPLPSQKTKWKLESIPGWLLWVLNPGAVTIVSYLLSSCLQRACESCSEAFENVDQQTFTFIIARAFVGMWASIKRAKRTIREEPLFYAAVGVWVVQGLVCWGLASLWGFPAALDEIVYIFTGGGYTVTEHQNKAVLVFSNVMLATGLAMKALCRLLSGQGRVFAFAEPRRLYRGQEARDSSGSCTDSRVPSMLIGWGIGYWVSSMLFVLGMGWHVYGRHHPPAILALVTYVLLPCVTFASIFMVADGNFFGTKIGAFIKPAVDLLRNRRSLVYWIMATVFRDALIIWTIVWAVVNGFLTPASGNQ